MISDIILLPVAVYLSYVLRLEGMSPASKWWPGMIALAVSVTVVTVLVFYFTGVYARFWRYASVDELMLLTGAFTIATLIAALAAIALGYVVGQPLWIPRSIPFILLLLGLAVTAGPRMFVRIWTRRAKRNRPHAGAAQPVLVMGAGDSGAALANEIHNNPQLGLDVVGFLDDDERKHNVVIHGVPVLGNRDAIPALARDLGVKQVIIAMPTASGKQIRDVVSICENAHVQPRTVPGTPELLDGRATVSQVRDVRIDDLLRREPITTDLAAVRSLLNGKRVLITGGGGSIGSELARQVHNCAPERIVLVGHGENSVFRVYHELLGRQGASGIASAVAIHPVIADIRSRSADGRCAGRGASGRHFPRRRAQTRAPHGDEPGRGRAEQRRRDAGALARGRRPRCRALRHDLDRQGRESHQRHGRHQARRGRARPGGGRTQRPRIRHRPLRQRAGQQRQRRAHLPTPDRRRRPRHRHAPRRRALLHDHPRGRPARAAGVRLGSGGELFMLDMGEPVKIVDLAQDLIRLSGLEVDRDIDITFTGLRPGEKLYEEMFMPSEAFARTEHAQIYIAQNGVYAGLPQLDEGVGALLQAAQRSDLPAVFAGLHTLVPGYRQLSQPSGAPDLAGVAVGASQGAPERVESE